ncbi:hypothetical protein MHU86_24468 [Fragilaria crotonensis]|nr:hypothetical protein MHU86_24468 [Fragilaria crotonensis]
MSYFSRKHSIPKEGTDGDGDCTGIMNERKILQPSMPCIQPKDNKSSQRTETTYVLDDRHDGKSKSLLGILEATSTNEVFQVLSKVSCPAGGERARHDSRSHDPKRESNLSESDVADIEYLIDTLNGPRSLFHASSESVGSLGPSIDLDSRSHAQLSSSREFPGGEMSHAFETFEAIGQMQLEQSLGSRPGQHEGQDSIAGDEPLAATPISLGLLFVLPSTLGLLCSVLSAVSWLTFRFPVSDIVVTHDVAHHDMLPNQAESDAFAGAIAISEACIVDQDVFIDKVPFIDDPMLAVEILPFAPLPELTNFPAMSNTNVPSTSLQIVHNGKGTSWTDTSAVHLSTVVLMAFAVAYILLPRRFAISQRRFEQFSVPNFMPNSKNADSHHPVAAFAKI